MRKIYVLTFVTMDGVMQQDPADGFPHANWTEGYFDDGVTQAMKKQMLGHDFDLLLGRRTYDGFAPYWQQSTEPGADEINRATKYVATSRPLSTDWKGTAVRLEGDVLEAIRKLKNGSGPEIQVHGSAALIQLLLKNDLVDELWLKIFPVTIGGGRRLFAEGTILAGWELVESSASASGVIIANYRRAGDI